MPNSYSHQEYFFENDNMAMSVSDPLLLFVLLIPARKRGLIYERLDLTVETATYRVDRSTTSIVRLSLLLSLLLRSIYAT